MRLDLPTQRFCTAPYSGGVTQLNRGFVLSTWLWALIAHKASESIRTTVYFVFSEVAINVSVTSLLALDATLVVTQEIIISTI